MNVGVWAVGVLAALGFAVAEDVKVDSDLKLWYSKPAADWNEALPVGTAGWRDGVRRAGGEYLQFNEDTLWTGNPHEYDKPDAADFLPEMRRLIFDGKENQARRSGESIS